MRLTADANALAPERLLVFEVTGSVQNFARAVARIAGLEFAGEEELAADDLDENPEFYLLVPQLGALQEIVSLWNQWKRTESLPYGYAPWRHLFSQLRAVRPWGPSDRVSPTTRDYLRNTIDGVPDEEPVRIEVELVYRASDHAAETAEATTSAYVKENGGQVVDGARHTGFAYHALLVDLPAAEVRRAVELDPTSLAGVHPVASIVPQSVGTLIEAADSVDEDVERPLPSEDNAVAAIFDAVPLQNHPLIVDRLFFDDPDNLESQAVGTRIHGTAMASLVMHGDLNDPASPLRRPVYFRPLMYAPEFGDERFDSGQLVIDAVVRAVMHMRENGGEQVIVVNLSLGDRTKPFSGKISTWARALDYLAFRYGILFIVSAGNVADGVPLNDFPNVGAFEAAELPVRASATFRGLNEVKADRRLLAPADSVNCLTIGAWHRDSSQEQFQGDSPFPPYQDDNEMPNVSSRLGLGMRRATKPDALLAGGRERVRIQPSSVSPILAPHLQPTRFWGLKVAAPSGDGGMGLHFTAGTSAATALATHTAHRIFDALNDAYPQLIAPMPLDERATLLKAVLVHSASWRGSDRFIRPIVDPASNIHHEHWRREVCRHLGYGFVDPEDAIACASDRATMWATGRLETEASLIFDMPIPAALTESADRREVKATLTWFTPIRSGHLAYRAVKLRIPSLQPDSLNAVGVETTSDQPTVTQSESGTIVHRRWSAERIGSLEIGNTFPIQVQRERDQGTTVDEAIPFALVVTIEMPGQLQIYDQVRAAIEIQPSIPVPA